MSLVVVVSTIATSAQAMSLRISDSRTDQLLACAALSEPQFGLSFIHSVSLTPVYDQYQLLSTEEGSHRILQTQERFIAHGQGLPSMNGEPDAVAFEHKDGEFILHLKRPINDLIVRTDSRFSNRLHTGTIKINLNQWSDVGLRIQPVDHCK